MVILAAGKGERLFPLTESTPKCLLPVGDRPLIEHSLDVLTDQGVSDITLVTGFRADKLDYLVQAYPQADIRFVHNAEYATTNNVYSLWLAKDLIKDGFMLLNSDIIYHPDILAASLADSASHIVVDDSKDLGEEEMKVIVRDGRISRISKLLIPESSHGEYIGILSFDKEMATHMIDAMDAMITEEELGSFYEHAIDRICKEQPIAVVSTKGQAWTEIDTHEDLEFARESVLTSILSDLPV